MADIARSVDYFSKDNGLKYEKDPIKEVSKKTSMPKNFLSFFTNLISFISQYNEAFKEENFNRMGQLIVTINDSIERYFKSDAKDLKPELKKISDNTTEEVFKYFKDKAKGLLSPEAAAEQIDDTISKFKKELIEKVQAIVFRREASEIAQRSPQNNADYKYSYETANAAVNAANKIVETKNLEFETNVQVFSIKLGKLVVSEFSNAVKKLTDSNLRSFRKGLERMNASFSSQFYGIVSSTNNAISQAQSRNKSFFSKIFRGMKYSAIAVTNTVSLAVTTLAVTYLTGKFILKRLLRWGGIVLGAMWSVVRFSFKLITKTIGLAFRGVKFVAMGVLKATGFMLKTTKKVIGGVFSLANTIFKKISGFSILGIVKGALKAFLFSYPGAFFLGYVCGKIWKSILKLAGMDDGDIAKGNYSIFKDLISPAISNAKKKIGGFFGDKAASFNDWWEEKKASFKDSDLYKQITNRFAAVFERIKSIGKEWAPIFMRIGNFMQSIVWPAIEWIYSALEIFLGPALKTPKRFIRNYGAILHGMKAIKFLSKHVKLRGGFAALLAGAVIAGSGIVLGTGIGETEKNDDDNPIKLPISKRFASLYGYDGGTAEDETFFEQYRPQIEIDYEYLHELRDKVRRERDPQQRARLQRQYNEVEKIYRTLMRRRDDLWRYDSIINELTDAYKDNKDVLWKASSHPMTKEILSDENGVLMMNPHDLDSMEVADQLSFLKSVIASRIMLTNNKLAAFKEASLVPDDPFQHVIDAFANLEREHLAISMVRSTRTAEGSGLTTAEGVPAALFVPEIRSVSEQENFDFRAPILRNGFVTAPSKVFVPNANKPAPIGDTGLGFALYDADRDVFNLRNTWAGKFARRHVIGADLAGYLDSYDLNERIERSRESYRMPTMSVNVADDSFNKLLYKVIKPITSELIEAFGDVLKGDIYILGGFTPNRSLLISDVYNLLSNNFLIPEIDKIIQSLTISNVWDYASNKNAPLDAFDVSYNIFKKSLDSLSRITDEERTSDVALNAVLEAIDAYKREEGGDMMRRLVEEEYRNLTDTTTSNEELMREINGYLATLTQELERR